MVDHLAMAAVLPLDSRNSGQDSDAPGRCGKPNERRWGVMRKLGSRMLVNFAGKNWVMFRCGFFAFFCVKAGCDFWKKNVTSECWSLKSSGLTMIFESYIYIYEKD